MSMKLIQLLSRQMAQGIVVVIISVLCGVSSTASAQISKIKIRLLPESRRAVIEANCLGTSTWSFPDSYAGIVGLGSRIERFVAFDENGNEISVRKSAPGQFDSLKPATRFQYGLNLAPPQRAADCPMVSWLEKERGLLMLADLLPVTTARDASTVHPGIQFELPASWTAHSSETQINQNEFDIGDVRRAVFAVGFRLRLTQTEESGMTLTLVSGGDWAFSETDVLDLSRKVLKAHHETFGGSPARTATFILFPFPIAVSATQWSAETRGTTVTLLSGKLPSKVAALAQLSTPVTHEFFHLWVPNGLALRGDYDWFYEGFTIYQASQTAVKLGLLTFSEFLSSIARAFDSSKNDADLSLIEASRRRFTGGLTSVYAKSQVVAFIYDLRLRSSSRNKKTSSDVYRKLIASFKFDAARAKSVDANTAVNTALSEAFGSDEFVRSFISRPMVINLSSELEPFGLKTESIGTRTQISVSDKLSKQQRDLLRDLGYNAATHAAR